jgi:hypothetical protein
VSGQTIPAANFRTPQTEIPNSVMSTTQLQRAWCVLLTRAIWPTIDPHTSLNIARWLYADRAGQD